MCGMEWIQNQLMLSFRSSMIECITICFGFGILHEKLYHVIPMSENFCISHAVTPPSLSLSLSENLILTADQRTVKLADFGLAREESLTEMMTAETGTYRWMAPEVSLRFLEIMLIVLNLLALFLGIS